MRRFDRGRILCFFLSLAFVGVLCGEAVSIDTPGTARMSIGNRWKKYILRNIGISVQSPLSFQEQEASAPRAAARIEEYRTCEAFSDTLWVTINYIRYAEAVGMKMIADGMVANFLKTNKVSNFKYNCQPMQRFGNPGMRVHATYLDAGKRYTMECSLFSNNKLNVWQMISIFESKDGQSQTTSDKMADSVSLL